MRSFRLLTLSTLLVAAFVRPAFTADDSPRLLQSVPDGTPFLVHVRSLTDLVENWQYTPYARMWADPEVRAFFAPAVGFLSSPEAEEALAKFESITGMKPAELVGLFPGELVVAVNLLPGEKGEPEPQFVLGAGIGENRAKIEALIKQAQESDAADDETIVEEEFQGETMHVAFVEDDDGDSPIDSVAWVFMDDVVWLGAPKSAVQEVVANLKRGGAAEPITASVGFAPAYQRNPDAHLSYYVNLEKLVQIGQSIYAAQTAAKQLAADDGSANVEGGDEEAASDEEGAMDEGAAQPSMMEQMGLTPEVIVHALGFDALRGVYATTTLGQAALSATAGLTWSEQRGLLRMIAYGDAPAPQPHFVAPDWASVTSLRFRFSEIWEAVKESARTANPMFEFMLAQQLEGLKQQLGVDVERDFFGSLGDEIVGADAFPKTAGATLGGKEQLWAVSLANSEAFGRSLDAIWAMAPAVGSQFVDREYLGHTIRSITLPFPGPTGMQAMALSYAVTPEQFFVGVGGAQMIETAIQRLNGDGESFWTRPEIVAAMKDLPAGGSSFTYQDLSYVMHGALVQFADLARKTAATEGGVEEEEPGLDEDGRPQLPRPGTKNPTPGLDQVIDPAALPSREVIAKYWGISTGAIYRDADGVRFLFRIKNAP